MTTLQSQIEQDWEGLDIPAFLRIPAERRAQAWREKPPTRIRANLQPLVRKEDPETTRLREAILAAERHARSQENARLDALPKKARARAKPAQRASGTKREPTPKRARVPRTNRYLDPFDPRYPDSAARVQSLAAPADPAPAPKGHKAPSKAPRSGRGTRARTRKVPDLSFLPKALRG